MIIIDFGCSGNNDPQWELDGAAPPPGAYLEAVGFSPVGFGPVGRAELALRLPYFRPLPAVIIEYIFRSH